MSPSMRKNVGWGLVIASFIGLGRGLTFTCLAVVLQLKR